MKKKPVIPELVVFTERLRNGLESLEIFIDPAQLSGDIDVVDFVEPISVIGDVYLAGNDLVLCFDWKGKCTQPCVICNESMAREIDQKNQYITVFEEKIKCGVFDLFPNIREHIIMNIDAYGECNNGKCPFRKTLQLD